MREIMPSLYELGLTVRGSYGEGSGAEGELFQISNELTLGLSEEEILRSVKDAVEKIVEFELREREQMLLDDERGLRDKVLRSYGILTNCATMEEGEFMQRMADVKLGVATKILHGNMSDLDNLVVAMRPANINRLNGAPLGEGDRNAYRAEYAGKALRSMKLFTWR